MSKFFDMHNKKVHARATLAMCGGFLKGENDIAKCIEAREFEKLNNYKEYGYFLSMIMKRFMNGTS